MNIVLLADDAFGFEGWGWFNIWFTYYYDIETKLFFLFYWFNGIVLFNYFF